MIHGYFLHQMHTYISNTAGQFPNILNFSYIVKQDYGPLKLTEQQGDNRF